MLPYPLRCHIACVSVIEYTAKRKQIKASKSRIGRCDLLLSPPGTNVNSQELRV